ncbi:MAG: hypothetical protein AB1715_05080 [Acidobacteriota bacterium]
MTKCSQCQKRKAKRFCPALGSDLCPLCCGLWREKKIHCPSGCTFLTRHKPYQENRIIRKKQASSGEIAPDERLSWLILHIEAPLQGASEKSPAFTDREAILALEYAKARVEKSRPRLLVSAASEEIKNPVGEAVWESLEKCRYQKTLILPQTIGAYTTEEKLKCLDNVISAVKHLTGGRLEGRNYLQELGRRFARLEKSSPRQQIITRD